MRVMAGYYTRVRMSRMSELLDLTEAVSSINRHVSYNPSKSCTDKTFVYYALPCMCLSVCMRQETEEFLSNLVVNKTVQAKIDRLEGIVYFKKQQDPNDVLNDWSYNINSLMQLVNKATHLITKEEMIHQLH